jgi:hypothetical protein
MLRLVKRYKAVSDNKFTKLKIEFDIKFLDRKVDDLLEQILP